MVIAIQSDTVHFYIQILHPTCLETSNDIAHVKTPEDNEVMYDEIGMNHLNEISLTKNSAYRSTNRN